MEKKKRGRPRKSDSEKEAAARKSPPPKRTGKRGIGPKPEAPEETTSAAAADEQPAGELVDTSEGEGSLLVKQPPKPTVVGDRIEAYFLKHTYSKTTEGKRLVSLHMTLPLTEEHTEDGLIPERIRDDWALMNKHGRTKLELNGIGGQRVCIFLSSNAPEDDPKLVLPAAKVTNVQLAVVQKKGDGETKKVIRLSFRLQVPVSDKVAKFADGHYGANYWIKLEEAQEALFDEDAKD